MSPQIQRVGLIIVALIIGAAVGYAFGALYAPQAPTTTATVTVTVTSPVTQVVTPTAAPPPAEKIRLTVIGPWAGAEMEAFQEVLKAFMRAYPNIEVEYRIYRAEDIASIAPVQFAAGMAPGDVIFTAWGWWVREMGDRGHLLDLSGLVNTDEFTPGIFDPVKSDNKIYGLPFTAFAKPGFWYRKSFFQAHGLQEPKTWNEFLDLLNKIKQISGIRAPIVSGDGVGWPLSDVTEHFIITFGGPEMQLKLIRGELRFNDPQVKAVFENYLVPLLKNGYFSEPMEWTKAIEEWWGGRYALYFMGTWITGMVPDPDDLGFFPLPGAKGVVMGTDYIFVPKYTKRPEEAKLLAKWLATEGQKIHAGTKAGKFATWLKVEVKDHWAPMQTVYEKVSRLQPLPDLDDTVGGEWQKLFWDQLKLLWVGPDKLNDVLNTLMVNFPKK